MYPNRLSWSQFGDDGCVEKRDGLLLDSAVEAMIICFNGDILYTGIDYGGSKFFMFEQFLDLGQ